MDVAERLQKLLTASPETLDAIDGVLAGRSRQGPPSLRLYRIGEAAKAIGRSRCSLWRAAKEGKIRTVRLREGGCRLIPEAELLRLVSGGRLET